MKNGGRWLSGLALALAMLLGGQDIGAAGWYNEVMVSCQEPLAGGVFVFSLIPKIITPPCPPMNCSDPERVFLSCVVNCSECEQMPCPVAVLCIMNQIVGCINNYTNLGWSASIIGESTFRVEGPQPFDKCVQEFGTPAGYPVTINCTVVNVCDGVPGNESGEQYQHTRGYDFHVLKEGEIPEEELEYGDAPENAMAYPDTGGLGGFPTCKTTGPSTWVQHNNFGAYFGPAFDLEMDGDAGLCPAFNPNQYDRDECFQDGDAGLIMPEPFTIQGPLGSETVVPCPSFQGTALGQVCHIAVWGQDIDIQVVNFMPNQTPGYVNVLMDWNRNGFWGGASSCGTNSAPEHVLVNFVVPNGFAGPLSALGPPPFVIGPTSGWVWARFTISEVPVPPSWDGSGSFEDGETEDYLLQVLGEGEEENCAKWIQGPDCEHGMDLSSFSIWDGQSAPPQGIVSLFRVADDWLCDGRPITEIRWWGSYPMWPMNQPPPQDRPDGFILRWWTDVPTNVSGQPYSMPGVELTNLVGWLATSGHPAVTESLICTSDLSFVQPGLVEYEYEYRLPLPRPWLEKEGQVYWLSVEAFYNQARPPITFWWGWKTTAPWNNWNDDAAGSNEGWPWIELRYPPAWHPWGGIEGHPYEGESVNMAFALLSDVCPSRCKKWAQPPDMEFGTDMWSWRRQGDLPGQANYQLRADDFISDGRPITDIHWWGSYSNWWAETPGGATNPVPPPPGVLRPLGFDLSWHLSEESPCVPGAPITNLFVPIAKCHEVYYGCVTQWWVRPGYYEHEYQYYVDLLDPEVSGEPWYEMEGTHYWLNIQAVFSNVFVGGGNPGQHGGWGWKTTRDLKLCGSVVSNSLPPGNPWMPDTRLPPPLPPGPFDLAFELTTTEPPATNSPWHRPIRFTNVAAQVRGPLVTMISTGHCGCGRQILQTSTNLLLTNGWSDVQTLVAPRDVNVWRQHSSDTQRFYRIKLTP